MKPIAGPIQLGYPVGGTMTVEVLTLKQAAKRLRATTEPIPGPILLMDGPAGSDTRDVCTMARSHFMDEGYDLRTWR